MKNSMRFIAVLVSALLAVSLFSCGTPAETDSGKETDRVSDSLPATESAAPDTQTTGTEAPAESTEQISVSPETDTAGSETEAEEVPYTVVTAKDAKVGDVIVFGSYEQDGNDSNGKEPLEWLVLANEGNSLLIITLYGIEHMQFHSSLDEVTWETSAVRGWLNNDFLAAAFSSTEGGMIKTTHIIAEENPEYPNSPAGNDTDDKVFLLSIQEAEMYFDDNNARKCSPTESARISEESVFSQMPSKAWYAKHPYGCSWWLRSPGMFKDLYVSYVGKYGDLSGGGQVYLSGTDFCVRPAMWIVND